MILSTREGMAKLAELWSHSRLALKIALVIALLWVAVHTLGYIYLTINPDESASGLGIGADYQFYAASGHILEQHGPIYDLVSNPFPAFTFKYHPAFVLVFAALNKLPAEVAVSLWFVLLAAGYLGGVYVWFLVFSRLRGFQWALIGLAALVPLLAYDWLGTFAFGNASPLLVLFNALLVLSILDRRPGWAGFLTAILLMVKFYWCFPLVILVVFREWRFLLRVLIIGALFYAGMTLLYLLAIGDWQYGLSMLRDYVIYMSITGSRQPWVGTESMFNTGNNAIYQTLVRYVGFVPWAGGVTFLIQLLLIGFLGWQIWKLWQGKVSRDNHPEQGLVVTGVMYIVLMCMLAEVNDGMLSSIVAVLLLSMTASRRWALLYIPLALVEIPTLIGATMGIDWLQFSLVLPLFLIGFVLLLIGAWRATLNPAFRVPPSVLEEDDDITRPSAAVRAPFRTTSRENRPRAPKYPGAAAIQVVGLCKDYQAGDHTIRAAEDLHFTVLPGQVFAFLGPNGAGKTTTIKMICGLITPTAGCARLYGYDVTRERSAAMAQIGVVLEGARNVYWRLSAWENLMYYGRLKGLGGKALNQRAEDLLHELGLWQRRSEQVRQFSRGMQQKIAIAAALVTDAPILLLDEPTLGLDVESARVIENWLGVLAYERGKSILLTTHQLDMAQRVSDQVAIIKQGRIIANQHTSELLRLFQKPTYEITVEGRIDAAAYPWLSGLTVTLDNGETSTIGGIDDQAMLYGLLDRLRDLQLPLRSVGRNAPDLEEVFVHLLHQEQSA